MHSFVCQLCTCSYTIIIANSEPPTFLPCSLTWHARWARQRGSELEKAYRACKMTYFTPLASLPLLADLWAPHVSFVFNLQPSPEAERLDDERALATEGGGAALAPRPCCYRAAAP